MAAKTAAPKTAVSAEYGADQIRKLKGLEAVRLRPGMYAGSTHGGASGGMPTALMTICREILDNSVDEALAGHCDSIIVDIRKDGSFSVKDNGRGIPVAKNADGEHAVHLVFEDLHAGGKFGDGGYKVSGGLHGVGASVANALSLWLKVRVRREGHIWEADYAKGERVNAIHKVGKADGKDDTGTTVIFRFDDDEIFEKGVAIDPSRIDRMLKDRSYLISGVKFTLRVEGEPERVYFNKEAGIAAYCREVAADHSPLHDKPLYFNDDAVVVTNGSADAEIGVEVALQWTQNTTENLFAFANIIRNPEGGMHVTGLKSALTKALNNYAYDQNKLKKDNGKKDPEKFDSRDVFAACTAIVSVKLANPQFEGQTKNKLNNSEVRSAVQTFLYAAFSEWLEDKRNAKDAKVILERCLHARRVRLAQGKVSKNYNPNSIWADSGQSAKLSDCLQSTPVEERELFIVEGDSAGGTAKEARNVNFQAILPLRGKPINAFAASSAKEKAKVFDNTEVQALISALGGRTEAIDGEMMVVLPPEQRRYSRVIALCDADDDGSHIAVLLYGIFATLFPDFLREGRFFLAKPPLFKINLDVRGDKFLYAYSPEEMQQIVKKHKPSGIISRFKGLGEMDAIQLEETVMNPDTRSLYQVSHEDVAGVEDTLSLLLGKNAARRKEWLETDGVRYLPQKPEPDRAA